MINLRLQKNKTILERNYVLMLFCLTKKEKFVLMLKTKI